MVIPQQQQIAWTKFSLTDAKLMVWDSVMNVASPSDPKA